MAHSHKVIDPDAYFKIDPITRVIESMSPSKIMVMQNDHNSERFTFEVPRYVEGHDMSLCDKVEFHYINIDAVQKSQQSSGVYTADDLKVNPDDEDTVICSWLISENATQYAGSLNFLVRFVCLDGTTATYKWNTAIFTGISVGSGHDCSVFIESEYVDIIEQWKESVMNSFTTDLAAWKEETKTEIETDLDTWKAEASEEVDANFNTHSGQWNNALAVERARIDAFVSLEEGSTTGDAELLDARIGTDGTVYKSAGTATREQFYMTDKKLAALGDFEPDMSNWKPVNIIEGYSWGENDYTYDNYGNLVTTEYTKNFRPITELVPAVSGATYQAEGLVGQIRIYTSDKRQLDLLYNNAMANQLSFTAPEDAYYFGIYYRYDIIDTEDRIAAIKLFRTSMTYEEYRDCPMVFKNGHISGEAINDASIGKNKLDDGTKNFISPLYGKTIVNFGDSIFGNARPPEDISTYIANLTGATVHNCGFGGCRMSYHPSKNYDAFSMTKLADAVASNDFSVQDTAIENTDGDSLPAYFAESVELLKNIDFNAVDIITIAYGANDFNGVKLDDADNILATNTFAGSLRYSIETIVTAYPHIRIFVCSPTYRFWMDSENKFVEDSDTKKGGAFYLTTDIVEKAKEVAAEYKLPYIDNYYSLGINKFNRTQYFPLTDGAHHNVNGRKLIAEHIVKNLF